MPDMQLWPMQVWRRLDFPCQMDIERIINTCFYHMNFFQQLCLKEVYLRKQYNSRLHKLDWIKLIFVFQN
jgi:hypothetical protein